MTYDPERFGKALRELRGNRSQPKVAEETGIPQYVISPLERGETQNPSFPTIVQLGLYYGLTPNDMATLAGLYASEESVDEVFDRDVARALNDVRTYAFQLDSPALQRRFASLLEDAVKEMKMLIERDELVASSSLPAFIRKKLQVIE